MSVVTNNATESTVRNVSVPTNQSNQVTTFDPSRIFIISAHGSETRLRVNENTRMFHTTIRNNEQVESEFPRLKVPNNVFLTFTNQLGVAQTPAPFYPNSFQLLNTHPISVPRLTEYTSYKQQIYKLGNDVYDNTFMKISTEVDPMMGAFMFPELMSSDFGFSQEEIPNYRFRSYGPIARATNIQSRDDTFMFFAPDVSVTIHTSDQRYDRDELEEDFLAIKSISKSAVIPIVEFQRRFPNNPENPSNNEYTFLFLGDIARNYTFGQIQSNLRTILESVPEETKLGFREFLKKVDLFNVWNPSHASLATFISDENLNNEALAEFLLHQVDMLKKHYVWGIDLTEGEFAAKRFPEIYDTKTSTKELVEKIIEKVGGDRPILVISYHCRSFLVGDETLNYEPIVQNIIRTMRNNSLSANEKKAAINALRVRKQAIKNKKGNFYKNIWNQEKGMSRKVARLEESSEGKTNGLIRFQRPILSRQLSMAAQPFLRTRGGKRKNIRKNKTRRTRNRKN